MSRDSINRILLTARKLSADHYEIEPPFEEDIGIDESYFEGKRIKGQRGRGVHEKSTFHWAEKRDKSLHRNHQLPPPQGWPPQSSVKGQIKLESIVHMDE